MAGAQICQRESLTVNHGLYYIDTTRGLDVQKSNPPSPYTLPDSVKKNVFQYGKAYDFFLLYANERTEQTYKMYVGTNFKVSDAKLIRVNIPTAPLSPRTDNLVLPAGAKEADILKVTGPDPDGVVEISLNLAKFAPEFAESAKDYCLPKTFCKWQANKVGNVGPGCVGVSGKDDDNAACSYAGKDIDCPKNGCIGFQIRLPASGDSAQFADNRVIDLEKRTKCFPDDDNWNIKNMNARRAGQNLAGSCFASQMSTWEVCTP
jgi:hypothetical protein